MTHVSAFPPFPSLRLDREGLTLHGDCDMLNQFSAFIKVYNPAMR